MNLDVIIPKTENKEDLIIEIETNNSNENIQVDVLENNQTERSITLNQVSQQEDIIITSTENCELRSQQINIINNINMSSSEKNLGKYQQENNDIKIDQNNHNDNIEKLSLPSNLNPSMSISYDHTTQNVINIPMNGMIANNDNNNNDDYNND